MVRYLKAKFNFSVKWLFMCLIGELRESTLFPNGNGEQTVGTYDEDVPFFDLQSFPNMM